MLLGFCLVLLHLNILLLSTLAGNDALAERETLSVSNGIYKDRLSFVTSICYSPVLVSLDLGNDDIGRVDGHLNSGSVGLFAGHSVNVNDKLLSVDLDNLSFSTLVRSTNNQNFVVSSNRERSNLRNCSKVSKQHLQHTDFSDDSPPDLGSYRS